MPKFVLSQQGPLFKCKKSCCFPLLVHMCLLSLFDFSCVRIFFVFLCSCIYVYWVCLTFHVSADEDAMAYKLASSFANELEDYIETTYTQQSRNMMECMVICLSSYYTLEECRDIWVRGLTLRHELWKMVQRKLAQRDEAAHEAHEAHVAVLRHMESMRTHNSKVNIF